MTRSYDFDVRGNRLSRATDTSGSGGTCSTNAGIVEAWTYDNADRVQTGANSTGTYVYDPLGRQTSLPAIDSPMGVAAGDLEIGYYDNDLVRTLTQDGTTTTFDMDALARRSTATSVNSAGTSTLVRHYANATDNPAWAVATGSDGIAHLTWYAKSIGGDLGLTVTDEVATVQLADIHGDTALPITLDAGAVATIGGYSDFDEYGRALAGTVAPDTGEIQYGWLGAKQRATDAATGLLLMGVRLYNPNTGLFTSADPVKGGNTTAYTYPQDPINKFDTTGKSWWSKIRHAAKRALASRVVRMLAAGVAAGLLCAGTAGLGCLIVAGAVVGVGLSVANYQANTKHRTNGGYLRAAGIGALEGAVAGLMSGSALGRELQVGTRLRIAPGGNRGPGRFQLPHYHRRVVDKSTGQTKPGGGIKWHRPWERGW